MCEWASIGHQGTTFYEIIIKITSTFRPETAGCVLINVFHSNFLFRNRILIGGYFQNSEALCVAVLLEHHTATVALYDVIGVKELRRGEDNGYDSEHLKDLCHHFLLTHLSLHRRRGPPHATDQWQPMRAERQPSQRHSINPKRCNLLKR